MNLWEKIFKLSGWRISLGIRLRNKCVICVAPHTSNLDFIIGLCAYKSMGRNANFLMKRFWFFFPLNIILKKFGGIPVDRNQSVSLTDKLIDQFKKKSYLNLAITPEGTRSPEEKWHTGFLYLAYGANTPIVLGVIDYKNKTVILEKEYFPTGNLDYDLKIIRTYYNEWAQVAKKPENFILYKDD